MFDKIVRRSCGLLKCTYSIPNFEYQTCRDISTCISLLLNFIISAYLICIIYKIKLLRNDITMLL